MSGDTGAEREETPMLVRDVMQTKLITASPQTTLPDALKLVAQRRVRHLPIVDSDGDLVGIVSDRDLKQAMASPATSLEAHELLFLLNRLQLDQIMTRTVVTIGPTSPVEDAARLMVQDKIGALPVLDEGKLVGIVTETDVLGLFVDALGAGEPSSRLEILLSADLAALGDVVVTIETAGVVISSLVVLKNRDGGPEAIVRVATLDPADAVQALEARGYAVRERWRMRSGACASGAPGGPKAGWR
jgi:acetoin utilization protein AcuB